MAPQRVAGQLARLLTLPTIALVLIATGCAASTRSPPRTAAPRAATTTLLATTSTTSTPARRRRPPRRPSASSPAGHGPGPSTWEVRPPSDLAWPEVPAGWTTTVAGRSVQGRDIEAFVRAVDAPRRRVLVIGGVHGNEPGTPPAVRGWCRPRSAPMSRCGSFGSPNPDGSAAGMRCNANGVDLNRNFPSDRRLDDGGPAPLSEPETQALVTLVDQLRPDVVVWVHLPLGYVSAIGATSAALETAWADATGLSVRRDITQHGGGESSSESCVLLGRR